MINNHLSKKQLLHELARNQDELVTMREEFARYKEEKEAEVERLKADCEKIRHERDNIRETLRKILNQSFVRKSERVKYEQDFAVEFPLFAYAGIELPKKNQSSGSEELGGQRRMPSL